MEIKPPILITGAARSGTSMSAGVVSICGAWGGRLSGASRHNEKGSFENHTIREHIVKPYLQNIGADPMGQRPLPDLSKDWLVAKMKADGPRWFRRAVITEIQSQGYLGGNWFYKGAKMCLMWPLWNSAFPEAIWIIVRRHGSSIVRSCLKTGFMRAYRNKDGWFYWVRQHEKRFQEMKEFNFCHEVWPHKMIAGNFSEIKSVIANIGLVWKDNEVKDFISPALWTGGDDYVSENN